MSTSTAREAILSRIRSARGTEASSAPAKERIQQPPKLTKPVLSGDLSQRMIEQMESVQISVTRLQTSSEIVDAVQWYLDSEGIDGGITVAPALADMDWPDHVVVGAASGEENTSVTPCLAAVAETGSLALSTSEDTPATLAFLPDNHIVIVNESQVVPHLEDVWDLVRETETIPRAVNLVTGPSRTGDIEQTIELGAHGPRRMHVLLVAETAT